MTAQPIQVDRVLDEEHTIVVTLDPEQVVDALATRLAGMSGALMLMRQLGAQHSQRIEARRRVIEALGSATLQVTLDRAGAVALIDELEVAAREPVTCVAAQCESLADEDWCAAHEDAGAGHVRRYSA